MKEEEAIAKRIAANQIQDTVADIVEAFVTHLKQELQDKGIYHAHVLVVSAHRLSDGKAVIVLKEDMIGAGAGEEANERMVLAKRILATNTHQVTPPSI
jgi:hypothetical protein